MEGAGQGSGAPVELAVVILNYRTAALSIDCLASLEGEVAAGVQVVVADNASGDGSAEAIAEAVAARGWSSWARVLRVERNGGFAAGNNAGIRSIEAEAYLLLNSDTLVKPGALAGLRRALREHPEAGIIGPTLVGADGQVQVSAFRAVHPLSELVRAAGTGPVTRLLRGFEPAMPVPGGPTRVDWVAFAAAVIRREVFRRAGPLDEGFFMYFEDVDYCRAARAAGFQVLYFPGPTIVHLVGGSSGVTDRAKARKRAPRYYYEARSRYYRKAYGRAGPIAANLAWLVGRSVAFGREVLQRRKPIARESEARDVWIGTLSGDCSRRGGPGRSGEMTFRELCALVSEDWRAHRRDSTLPGFRAVAIHRFGNWRMGIRPKLLRAPFSAIYRAMFRHVRNVYGIELPYTVELGRRVIIEHQGGIVVHGAAKIGDGCILRQGVTIGNRSLDRPHDAPILGRDVNVGAGAVILGGVNVGDGAQVGANSVVIGDVPAGATAVGVPAVVREGARRGSVRAIDSK